MNTNDENIFNTSFGTILAETRKARGLTIYQIADETKIIEIYLDALESEQLDIFPAAVYARSFLKLYAEYLGVDLSALSDSLPVDIDRLESLQPLPNLGKSKLQTIYEDFLAVEFNTYIILGIFLLLFLIFIILFI
ncbi:MAG: helix-turn-helix transcriptional regulator [Dehalococcoidia bacterium]|jgi:cytoskeletal protein RodZ|nr:MAG: protein RodZ, contains Xre-like HTH and DUF4115 domains [Chloroflexota bacterium]|tara:strand:+ start:1662 stop:2069 length:408 start_codon:yes stop_codon:yes gene_type:complete